MIQPQGSEEGNPLMSFLPLIIIIIIIWAIVSASKKRRRMKNNDSNGQGISNTNSAESVNNIFCINCGKPVKKPSKFCGFCGAKQE